ncbi:MAG: lysoplasmalogenase [Chlorobi bacterium]|nr:lysoplasmalogenase [Chlorobiota bacterium]
MQLFKNEKSFSTIFFIIVLLELISGNIESLSQLHYFTKPLILTSLIVLFWSKSKHLPKAVRNITLLALIFSLTGDILLMFVGTSADFFIGGLVAFLLAHIMYILTFLKKRNKTINPLPIIIILLIYAIGVFYIIKDGLGDMQIPVLLYLTVILTMVVMASLRKGKVSNKSYNLVVVGALFFMISDSVLSINKFYQSFASAGLIIMFTYALAQYLIVMGILKQRD